MSEHVDAPWGLVAPLPAGERILWQGAPRPWSFLKQIFHPQLLLLYVAGLLGWCLAAGLRDGDMLHAAIVAAKFAGMSAAALAMLAGLARLQAGSTTYTITSRRVVITFGAALDKTLQIPFASIAAAGVRAHADGTADLVLTLRPGERANYLLLWPNARPWKLYPAEPMLRAVRDGQAVAQILGRALAADAGVAPVAVTDVPQAASDATVAAAA